MPPETLHAGQAEAVHTRCCALLVASCACGAVISSWGEDGVLLWVGHGRIP